jgi:hypothetical protein
MIAQIKRIVLSGMAVLAFCMSVVAQEPKSKTIDVTSTFKPVLREASKINFNAASPASDTTRPRLTYNIPVQNLVFTYQPAELEPVALPMDTLEAWKYDNYIKVGIGSVHVPYVKAGFSFGDRKNTFFNLFASHYSSKGSLPFQKNSQTQVGAAATYKTKNNHEWNGGLGFSSDNYYLYGFRPESLPLGKEDLQQRFQTIEGKVNFRNIEETEFGLNYNPSLRVSSFSDNHDDKHAETNSVLDLPLEKRFGEKFSFKLGATADLTNYRHNPSSGVGSSSLQNNLFYVSTAIILKTPTLYLHGGIRPSWDRKNFHMLPNIMADITTSDQRFTVQAGFIGYYEKGSYQRFASINPWLAAPSDSAILSTRIVEGYLGLKGSLGDHFSYSGKIGMARFHNIPLFVNDFSKDGGNSFIIRYEPQLDALQIHGEVGYHIGEQFSAKAALNLRNFTKLEKEDKAWGMIPMELNAGLRWQLLKDLWFYTDLWVWDGGRKLGLNGEDFKMKGAFDLSSGAEFRITKNFNLWLQLNNILNNKYERWNQYQVYGFNILGGVTYSFSQK